MNVLLICCALLVLMSGGLSFNVSHIKPKRLKSSAVSDAAATKAVRAGQCGQNICLFVALLLYADATNRTLRLVHALR